ncbi:hypothetical protein BBOV_II005550 [Babesia bovis T2Bo]|uniref:HSA domain-containing protein n=1 Tax=Babesia bovis TaxID=5865 RepID=A7AU95_BABBO|nr:hypothetical protein BBOV_II005550 [Babesia bovis T2Bo]EDO06506.1 hypothetical protein BBOV_II005550 [Babesia bovis T2Bo]|eukprot:XP_001610074.1 hypothetical protein [Babesia bovis T2Bo]
MALESDMGPPTTPVKSEDEAVYDDSLAEKVMDFFSGGRVITRSEPMQSSRSYKELILQEMNWMACDYYHERRWKCHVNKQLSIGIKVAIMDRKKLNKNWVANECSNHVKRFWVEFLNGPQYCSPFSQELTEYCTNIANKYLNYTQADVEEGTKDYEMGPRDLIAIPVPLVPLRDSSPEPKVPISKISVIDAATLKMQSMGAEFYRPMFRPPDEDLDVFTLPLMDPIKDVDFNSFLVQNFCVKRCSHLKIRSHIKHEIRMPKMPLLSRKFIRVTNDPSCLSISQRDFDLQIKPKPLFHGLMVRTKLCSSDFELLDPWMISDSTSWPMIAICLTYRSSTSGLHRHEFGVDYCRKVFQNFKRLPRGLVNSSRRLLGPRQRNAITTFLGAPPRRQKYEPLVQLFDREDDIKPQTKRSRVFNVQEMLHCCLGSTKDEPTIKRRFSMSLEEMYMPQLKDSISYSNNLAQSNQDVDLYRENQEVVISLSSYSEDNDDNVEPSSGLLPLASSQGSSFENMDENLVRFPLSDISLSGTTGLNLKCLRRKSITEQRRGASNTNDPIIFEKTDSATVDSETVVIPSNARLEVAIATGNFKQRPCFRSDRKTDPLLHMPNVPYGEYSNRMSKQLRVGFLGIPAKMFAHSLFYSGRFSKNNRVRRVAVAIATSTKIVLPQPNLIHARLFEHDAMSIFARFRNQNWQRTVNHTTGAHGEQLLKKYANEIINSSDKRGNTHMEIKPVDILAAFVNMKLQKNETMKQSVFLPNKILANTIEQVVASAPIPQNTQTPVAQQRNPQPVRHTPMQGHGISPRATVQPNMMPQTVPVQQMQNTMLQMHPPQMQQQQQPPMAPQPSPKGHMVHPSMIPGGMQQGHMTPGPMGAIKKAPAQLPPGSLPPAHMPGGGMHPTHMVPGKAQPGPMQGMPPPMQLKRRYPVEPQGKRRPRGPYDQVYPQQMHQQSYRYRNMPDHHMMRIPIYPMAMYTKQAPFPKSHDDPYRGSHVQR